MGVSAERGARTRRPGGQETPAGPSEVAGLPGEGAWLAGRYRLKVRLGERHGSTAWRATDEVFGRPVAVRTFAAGSQLAGQAAAAARAACRVSDPRLSKVFDADDHADPPYIVTQWPSGVCLGERLATGPLVPWQAVAMIADAAEAVAAAHEAELAHLCLTPDSVWCDADGGLTITGLQIDAAIAGARAADPAQEDTRGLARLLYAALTGCWPGPEHTTLPPAPRPGGRVRTPRQVRPGIPASIDAVTCRALYEEACGGQPPILGPAQLAMELAAIRWHGPPFMPVPCPAPTQPLTPSTLPLTPPTALVAAPPLAATVTLWRGSADTSADPPAGRGAPATPGSGTAPQPPARSWMSELPPMTLRKLSGIIIVLAVLTAGGWLLAHELTALRRPAAAAPPTAQAHTLTPARAAAFGTRGEGNGDNPQLAPFAIDGNPATAWRTDWYTTADLGNLEPGTGLLLDMGRPVTVTATRITLGGASGASLQIRIGAAPALTRMPPVGHVSDTGGVVRLRLTTPAHGRYVLLWFTRLPPDPAGTFQASIYDVRLEGPA
jgi:hypothetical protein